MNPPCRDRMMLARLLLVIGLVAACRFRRGADGRPFAAAWSFAGQRRLDAGARAAGPDGPRAGQPRHLLDVRRHGSGRVRSGPRVARPAVAALGGIPDLGGQQSVGHDRRPGDVLQGGPRPQRAGHLLRRADALRGHAATPPAGRLRPPWPMPRKRAGDGGCIGSSVGTCNAR